MFYINPINKLAYLDSLNIKVFPSGRRKSELINENGLTTKYHIPIDPEARLNTEANHRKHSGLNGYKQNYILDWNGEYISLVLAGYLFTIKLSSEFLPKEENGNKNSWQLISEYLVENLIDMSGNEIVNDKIFVNILTADVPFFSSLSANGSDSIKVNTEILHDQAFNTNASTCLDLCKTDEPPNKIASYYFSGLSFSAEPLETIKESSGQTIPADMHVESLLLLNKVANEWHIHEPSRLPVIDHGDTENSVKIPGDLIVDESITIGSTLTAEDVIIGDMKAITLEVTETSTDKWQLRFNNAKISSRS